MQKWHGWTGSALIRSAPALLASVFLFVGNGCASDSSSPDSASGSQLGSAASACDRYCAKLSSISCGEHEPLAACTSDCEQKRQLFPSCLLEADALRDCITTHGSAQCQAYNGEAEVVAPPDACNTEHAAFDECNVQ